MKAVMTGWTENDIKNLGNNTLMLNYHTHAWNKTIQGGHPNHGHMQLSTVLAALCGQVRCSSSTNGFAVLQLSCSKSQHSHNTACLYTLHTAVMIILVLSSISFTLVLLSPQ